MASLANAVGNFVKKAASLGESAESYKSKIDGQIQRLETQVGELSGKEHHKERTALGKKVSALKGEDRYIDACRVVKGLMPVHGNFTNEIQAATTKMSADEAARIAQETEEALMQMEPVQKPEPPQGDHEKRKNWQDRLAILEKKVSCEVSHKTTSTQPAVSREDAEELEVIAQEVVDYKETLKKNSGYTNKSLKADQELAKIEERLDYLAEFLLLPQRFMENGPSVEWTQADGKKDVPTPPSISFVVAQLAERERQLARRLARHREASGLSPSEAKEVEELLVRLAERKAYLRTEGYTEKEQDKDEQVMGWLIGLQELREKEIHDKKRAKHISKEMEEDLHELVKLEEDLESLKRDMKAERDCSNKDLKHDPVLCELEERLVVLRRFGV